MNRYTYISETKSFAVGDRIASLNMKISNLRGDYSEESRKDNPDRNKLRILQLKQDIVRQKIQLEMAKQAYQAQVDSINDIIDQKKIAIDRIKELMD